MICLKNIDSTHLEQIASVFAEAFTAEEGTVQKALSFEEAVIYFRLTLFEYSRIGRLFALSEKEEGYAVWHRKNEGLRWYRDLWLFIRYLKYMKTESMQKMILVRRGWTDYTLKYAGLKDYTEVALLCVRKDCQGKGYMHQLLKDPFDDAAGARIPCILDTDSSLKADKYMHCGMKAADEKILESGVHMFTMIYDPSLNE